MDEQENSVSDQWQQTRRESQAKRANNREGSAKILQEKGVVFISKSNGAHLIVTHNGLVVDFWPGTGKWIVRDQPREVFIKDYEGRGVFPLLKRLGVR